MSTPSQYALSLEPSEIDNYLVQSLEQGQVSRRLWSIFSMTALAAIAIFIALQ